MNSIHEAALCSILTCKSMEPLSIENSLVNKNVKITENVLKNSCGLLFGS